MRTINGRSPLSLLLFGALALGATTQAQKPSQPKPGEPDDDVVRVKTELVQTDVTVVDKRGRVVEGVAPEQFQLRVDGKPQTLAFFEQVATGTATEEKQLAAARNGKAAISPDPSSTRETEARGRLIFFFIDDTHLASDSLVRARSLLTRFVEQHMIAGDRVAIISASGQIGFLQQLTDNKVVLREAINRINSRYNPETIASHVSISEVDANLVANHRDGGLFAYLVEATMKEYQTDVVNAVNIVKNRVRQINAQSSKVEIETLSRLENLIRSTAPLAGRKLVFLISDGFVVDAKRSNGSDVMRRVAQEAARVGSVIYSLDTRANFPGAGVDTSKNDYPDFSSRTAGRSVAEDTMPQAPLETLADETGGRSYLNSNSLDDGLSQALAENSTYYLLAWKPDSDKQRSGKSRIDVTIKDRPDLRVRVRRHFFAPTVSASAKAIDSSKTTPEDELKSALGSLYPRRDLPTLVSVRLVNNGKGPLLNVLMQIDSEMLSFDAVGGKQQAIVDVLGVAIDDRGSFSSFKQRLEIPRAAALANRYVNWTQSLTLSPGLYQVRVAVRDRQTTRTGSAMLWIEIPRPDEPGKRD